jgi:DNA-binding response OmpR family regulator
MTLILLADDDEMIGDIVRETLTGCGYVVGVVENGRDAVRAVQLKQPALVILDCGMPELSGEDVLRSIRLSAGGYRTPVLMLTARRSAMDVEIARRAGANDYLKKPFDPDDLVVRVENLLSKAEAARSPRQ